MAALNDEQVMLRDMAREWVDNESPVAAFRRVRDEAPAFGFDTRAAIAQGMGVWTLLPYVTVLAVVQLVLWQAAEGRAKVPTPV